MQSTWPAEIKRDVLRHFYGYNVSYPWDKDRNMSEGNYVTLDVFDPDFTDRGDHWKADFDIKIVITSQDKNLYAIDNVHGLVLQALTDIPILDSCASRDRRINSDKIDWAHGREQMLIQTSYHLNLRG